MEIFTFGGFEARIDGKPVTGFHSRKVIALLVYLAAHKPLQSREALAELLWPARSQRQSLSNLRVAISSLRKILGDHLVIQRDKIGLKRNENLWVDLDELEVGLEKDQPEKSIQLYRGNFLEGFYVPDATEFDQWVLIEREKFRQEITLALQGLVVTFRQRGAAHEAFSFARRLVDLDRMNETGQLELLRQLASAGQRASALAQYADYQKYLFQELGLEPTPEMKAFASQLKSGEWIPEMVSVDGSGKSSLFSNRVVEQNSLKTKTVMNPFAGRERELAVLESHLRHVYDERGKVIFIAGEAGSGKTTLAREFIKRAQDKHPELLSAIGTCTVFVGTGDPFLPFRDVFAQLSGDCEKWVSARTITREQAVRLEDFRNFTAQIIWGYGREIIGSLFPARILEEQGQGARLATQKDWKSIHDLVPGEINTENLLLNQFYEQFTDVFIQIARRRPMLILLEDLHWADPSSISLLSHLSSRISASPILILGTYRPEEVADKTHPFGRTISEFLRQSGERPVDLNRQDEVEKVKFVNALIDFEPNNLDRNFREKLVRLTGGNALFAVELIQDIKDRGLLVRDVSGCWKEVRKLDWESLPSRVDAILERRARQLDECTRSVLEVASVEGVEFTAEIISQILGMDLYDVIRRLSSKAVLHNRLVEESGSGQVGDKKLSFHRFRHGLFQKYFYDHLGSAERTYLHEQIGTVVENFLRELPEQLASNSSRLAWHFQEAGDTGRAIAYLLMAGKRAMELSASREAVRHLQRGLELLPTINPLEIRNRKEIELQLALCVPLQTLKGYTDPEVRQTYERARQLSFELKNQWELLPNLYFLRTFHNTPEERRRTRLVAEELLCSPEKITDPCLISLAQWALGSELSYLGEFLQARCYLEKAAENFDSQANASIISLYGNDPGIASRSRLSWVLWFLGYPDQARRYSRAALALIEDSKFPLVRGFAMGRAGVMFHQIIGEVITAHYWNQKSRENSEREGARLFNPAETILRGWIQVEMGEVNEGISQMSQGLDAWRASRSEMHLPHYLGLFANAFKKAGQVEKGLDFISEALAVAESNNERYYESELIRIKGEILYQMGDISSAEEAFLRGIEVARIQKAKSLELRLTLSLSKLWSEQGRREHALKGLSKIHTWFTEGFDTPDLKTARELLSKLQ